MKKRGKMWYGVFPWQGKKKWVSLPRNVESSDSHHTTMQRVLGHSSIQVTLDVYGHLLPEAGAEVAARLEQLFFAKS